MQPIHNPPSVLYPGTRCLGCLQTSTVNAIGICDSCGPA
jgi:rRNA maturation endonuclease Nob1